ncbi:hypothetical protein EV645_3993 [Kribbella rubisoli]|uniref:Uncharacterized protein n=1 Tax=Kribbella rubisoli TaxID=3075929 RepID=A0A4Q7X1F0_9ACTN|nr:hypothetical protein [Kribbella rubisoli]RZU16428.1 hypothetical protein EV645_3993 [Kribbella rubisoli]
MSRREFAAARSAGLLVRNEVRLVRALETSAVTLLVRYLQAHGFPYVERQPSSSNRALDAIAGTPGVVWSVRSTRDPSGVPDVRQVDGWLVALEAYVRRVGADVAVLVVAVPGAQLSEVAGWRAVVSHGPGRRWRLLVGAVPPLLAAMGYGGAPCPDDPPEAA